MRCADSDRGAVEAVLDENLPMSLGDRRAAYEVDGWRHDETEAEANLRTGGAAIFGRM